MSESPKHTDPRERPYDPAGTRPRHDPKDIVPRARDIDPDAEARGESLWSTRPDDTPAPAATPAHDRPDGAVLTAATSAAPHLDRPALDPLAIQDAAPPAGTPRAAGARMQIVLGALVTIAVAALAAAVLITVSGGEDAPSGPRWSAWMPDGDAGERIQEIATRVGRQYRGSDGSQLVVVTGGPLEVAGLPLTVALREPVAQGGDVEIEEGKGVLYRLCGLGDRCAIAAGKPSRERHLLLRREALELALYSFHYTDVDQVVVFMPPPKGKDPDEALFFKRSDLEPQIKRPLAESLTPSTPSVASVTRSTDAPFVQDLTLETLFKFSLTQGNSDQRAFLVLDPLLAKTP